MGCFLLHKWKQQRTKQGVQADLVQICVLQIESYIIKPPRGEGPSFITKLTLVPFDMFLAIWG